MTDINAKVGERPEAPGKVADKAGRAGRPAADVAADWREIRFIELLFFAYRDFISDPDAVLIDYGFGRAHHRVIHFVNRQPGIRVADLLDILKITKQSLGRVLKQLVDMGFIEQRPGEQDRRQRLLYPTAAGHALAQRLLDPQAERIGRALAALSPGGLAGAEEFLRLIVDANEREKVARLIKR
jgi:DNA-binding MarR family transcriptional regulator